MEKKGGGTEGGGVNFHTQYVAAVTSCPDVPSNPDCPPPVPDAGQQRHICTSTSIQPTQSHMDGCLERNLESLNINTKTICDSCCIFLCDACFSKKCKLTEWVSIRHICCLALASIAFHVQDGFGFIWCGMADAHLLSNAIYDHQ